MTRRIVALHLGVLLLAGTVRAQGPDCRVNDPTADPNNAALCHEHGSAEDPSGRAQSETSVLLLAGNLCVAWNKLQGIHRATSDDGGQTFDDLGQFILTDPNYLPDADPSFVYRASDQRIYFAGIIAPCWEQIPEDLPAEEWYARREECEAAAHLAVCGRARCY
jgi:hypothetical protein